MIKKLKQIFLVLAISLGIGIVAPSFAQASVIEEQCEGVTDSLVCKDQDAEPESLATTIISTLLFIVGALSVVMIMVGGLMYITSAGDSGRVTTAKNTIMYAVIGLVVSFLAFVIVRFVVGKIS